MCLRTGHKNYHPFPPERIYMASLVNPMVKNMPAMQESWVPSLGWKGLLEKGMATHPSILAWRIPWPRIHSAIWLFLPIQEHGITFKFFETSLIFLMTVLRSPLVAQLVKNPPAIQETLVQFLGWKDVREKG